MSTRTERARGSLGPGYDAGARWHCAALLCAVLPFAGCGDDATGPPTPAPAPAVIARIGADRDGAYRDIGGLDTDASGRVFVFDRGEVQVFDAAGQATRRFTLVDSAGHSPSVGGLVLAPDGTLITGSDGGRLSAFTTTGAFVRSFGCADCGLSSYSTPLPLDIDAAGNVYLLDTRHQRIVRFDPAGNLLPALGSRTSEPGGFLYATNLVADPAGFVYVSDRETGRITRYAADGTLRGSFAYSQETYAPRAQLGMLPDGKLLVATALPTFELWSGEGERLGTLRLPIPIGRSGGLQLLRVGRDGRFYLTDAYGQLFRLEADGSGMVQLGRLYGAGAADLVGMGRLAARDGNVYVITEGGNRIRRFDLAGRPLDAWRSVRDNVGFADVALDAAGQAYAAISGTNEIARLDPGGVIAPLFVVPLPPGASPYGLGVSTLEMDGSGGFFLRFGSGDTGDLLERVSAQGALLAWRTAAVPGEGVRLDPLDAVRAGGAGEYWALLRYPPRLLRMNEALEVVEDIPLVGPNALQEFAALDFVIDPTGALTVIVPGALPNVLRFDRAGRWLDGWSLGDGLRSYSWPRQLACDETGRLYFTVERTGKVLVYAAPAAGPGEVR